MGRHCGWLTAATARKYKDELLATAFIPGIGFDARKSDIHAIYVPELAIDIESEAKRLKKIMDDIGCVNIFISEVTLPPTALRLPPPQNPAPRT